MKNAGRGGEAERMAIMMLFWMLLAAYPVEGDIIRRRLADDDA